VAIRFYDTSALVPRYSDSHVHHDASVAAFRRLRPDERACGLHSFAEIFNTLTKSAGSENTALDHASEFLRFLRSSMTIVKPATEDYFAVIERLVAIQLGGPLIYDALLLQAARKMQAETIYTWNVRHFQLLAPDLADRIRTP